MRVTIVSRIYAPEPAAASAMLGAIAAACAAAGHDVTVVTTAVPGYGEDSPDERITVKRAAVKRDAHGYVRGYVSYMSFDLPLFFRLLFSKRPDVYVVEPPPTTGAVVRVIAWLKRRPYVYDAADVWSDAAALATSSAVVLRLLRIVELFAMRGASHSIAISQGVVDRLRELHVSTAATVIGFGVDTATFRYRDEHEADDDAHPYLIYAGSYSEWHGAGIFVEAFALFSAAHPEYRLRFVGNGSEREALEARCEELSLATVSFHDPVDGARLSPMLARARVSLASLKPGQGYDYAFTTKVYSAIASGCPVLFTGVGPTAGFIAEGSTGHRVGVAVPYNVADVLAAMEDFASRSMSVAERRALSEWARDMYSLDAIGSRVEHVLVGVAGASS